MTTSSDRPRVVVTGMGAVTPIGNDVETFWQSLLGGEAGAGPITLFDAADYPVTFACEVKEFDPARWVERRSVRRMDRAAHFAVAAALMAAEDSRLDLGHVRERTAVSVATGMGGARTFQECAWTVRERGPDRLNPSLIGAVLPNMPAAWVSIELGAQAFLASTSTACAASTMAIGEAFDALRLGRADVVFAGGTEAVITPVGIAGFAAIRALSRRNDDPLRASRPFDAARDGFVMGEGAGMLVLERLEHARARGAEIHAEIAGYGASSDARHVTEPDPTGRIPARALAGALADAGLEVHDVDYMNAHGTSTPLGDATETRVVKLALGDEKARATPVSSIKGATGHCVGASGALEAIASVLAVKRDVLPPTINYEEPDPECDLDYVPNEPRAARCGVALTNSFGFGGHNACLVVREFEG
jgi:3-oxoacyl-[acyl-carrier-protein] synthase II